MNLLEEMGDVLDKTNFVAIEWANDVFIFYQRSTDGPNPRRLVFQFPMATKEFPVSNSPTFTKEEFDRMVGFLETFSVRLKATRPFFLSSRTSELPCRFFGSLTPIGCQAVLFLL